MTDRWFSQEELAELSRPTMDRAIEAIDAGDLQEARRLCSEMKHEWQMLHDLMAGGVLDLVSFIQQRLGDEGVAEAWSESMGRGWRRHHDAIVSIDRRQIVLLLAATWRAHSCSGVGPEPGQLHDHRGRGEGHVRDEPVRLGPAPRAQRRLRGAARRRADARGPRLVLRPQGLPPLLHPLLVHERVDADPVVGLSRCIRPSRPQDYSKDPCTWYWYKDPEDIPERHWSRYGAVKGAGPGAA